MTPDELIRALALLVEEVCEHTIKLRVAGKAITAEEWEELDHRWRTLVAMNKPRKEMDYGS
jgi:hypothetical protein